MRSMSRGPITALGVRIRTLRKERGWRQIDLADHAGMSENYISDLENGRKEICLLSIMAIAESFGMKASDLIQGL